MTILKICIVALAMISLTTPTLLAQSVDYHARIGAWNLGAKGSGNNRYIEDRRIPALAQIIAMLGPDVIAVSEVAPDSSVGKIKKHLELAGLCYRWIIIDQPSALNNAFLHRCYVSASNPRLIPESGYGSSDNRKALAVDFRIGTFDFTAISVHFKSGRKVDNRELRNEQVAAVWRYVEDVIIPNEKDVLVLGDYNMIPSDDVINFDKLNPKDFFRFITSDDLEARPGFIEPFSHISRHGRPGNLLDGFAISNIHTTEYKSDTVRIAPMDEFIGVNLRKFRDRYSDHLPVIAVFSVGKDDD